ncbi:MULTISPECIES: Gfo/Idh/MocA family oxidoreductase [unclassified Micromonospora]|uniref:Gfo/Idh/MocA family protein n=1 Tax=unclassified Micromonospora TaxID=2617518 RepID=UPI003322CBF4
MRRIGIIGTENSHVDHFIRFLNTEQRHPGNRVVALTGGPSDRNTALCETGGIDLVVGEPSDLVGRVDAAIISSRDGRHHRKQAEPLLDAGLPVLVDKPLAASVDDAQAILAAAARGHAPLVSCSALRFVPEVARLTDPAERIGRLRQLAVIGPADPDSEWAGLFFYGIHQVELALQLLGDPHVEPESVSVDLVREGDTTVALTRIADVVVTFTFVTPADDRVPFQVMATGTRGVLTESPTIGPDYNAPALARFIDACDQGRSPVDPRTLLSPIVVMAAITDALTSRS